MAPHPMESAAPAQGVPHVERRLAAILSADVKGYSRLMGANDVATVETLTAYREVIAQLDCESLGEHTLKNIEGPVRVFRVRLTPARGDAPPGPPLTTVGQASKRSETLSVAVLPFANMSGDPEQEHFTDGITDDIITDLSKIGELTVIARSSTFAYEDTVFKIPDIGRELGVRYVLEGSVRKVGEQVRITAQLVDAVTAHHLWAERYDRDLKDVFAIQDEISHKIAMALKLTLTAENEAPGPS